MDKGQNSRETAILKGVEEEETAGVQAGNKEEQNHGKLRGVRSEWGKLVSNTTERMESQQNTTEQVNILGSLC